MLLVATLLHSPAAGDPSTISRRTRHLKLTASLSSRVLTPARRTMLIVDVEPRRGMHLYAPGSKYQPVTIVLEPQTGLRVSNTVYPAATPYYFKPLNETVDVYDAPFRLRVDVTFEQPPAPALTGAAAIVLKGSLDYQACDDRVCYLPESVPFMLAVDVTTGTERSDRRRR